jgi:tetratricopeptide (TPR) repeat protein
MASRKTTKTAKKVAGSKRAPRKKPASTSAKTSAGDAKALPFEIDPSRIEESLQALRDTVVKWAKKGRYTKVRFKFRGKQVLPDIPLAAILAVEGVTFYWTGLLRALVFNVAGKSVLDVELVNDAEKEIAHGKDALLSGDLDEALRAFQRANDMDHDNVTIHINLGIAYKLKGQFDHAREVLERALQLEPDGNQATEVRKLLDSLPAFGASAPK